MTVEQLIQELRKVVLVVPHAAQMQVNAFSLSTGKYTHTSMVKPVLRVTINPHTSTVELDS